MQTLYVKYRPNKFEDVIGQDSIVKILQKQIELKKFKNAFIFSGASGCGKTTLARIFATAINQGVGSPIEIDAASHNSVENIRQIIDSADTRSLDGEYKIYILDEAHMLTTQAWNALLKTIEETPKYTIFMFCTTEFNKIPETIQNRCQSYFLKRVPHDKIYERLLYICQQEAIDASDSALDTIAKISNGSVRQAISYLEKCHDLRDRVDSTCVTDALGIASTESMLHLFECIVKKDSKGIIKDIDFLYMNGIDLRVFLDNFIDFSMNLCKYAIFRSFDVVSIPAVYVDRLNTIISTEGVQRYLSQALEKLLSIKKATKGDTDIKTSLEIYLMQL